MSKKMVVCFVVVGLVGTSFGGEDPEALWQNSTGDGDFCNTQNWGGNPPAGIECLIDEQGLTHADCTITVEKLKGPSYNNENVTAELSSGTVNVDVAGYCRIAYYAQGGHLTISGGTLNAQCDDGSGPGFAVGLDYAGTLTVTAGVVRAKNMWLATEKGGDDPHEYHGGTSTVNLQGGLIEAESLQSKHPDNAAFIISDTGVLTLPGNQSLDSLPTWVTFEGGDGVAEYDTQEYPGRTKFSVSAGVPECDCMGDMTNDGWLSPADVSAVVTQLLPHGSNAYWKMATPGHCGDLTDDDWLSPADVSAIVTQLLPYASNTYWKICPQ